MILRTTQTAAARSHVNGTTLSRQGKVSKALVPENLCVSIFSKAPAPTTKPRNKNDRTTESEGDRFIRQNVRSPKNVIDDELYESKKSDVVLPLVSLSIFLPRLNSWFTFPRTADGWPNQARESSRTAWRHLSTWAVNLNASFQVQRARRGGTWDVRTERIISAGKH